MNRTRSRSRKESVIWISDSEEEQCPPKRLRSETNSQINEQENNATKDVQRSNQALPDVATNSISEDLSISGVPENNTGGSHRNSFWGRRKVWTIPELLAQNENINPCTANKIVDLFENDNTIPFICRYRRDLINHATPEELVEIKNSYIEIVNLRQKANQMVTSLKKNNLHNEDIETEILCAKSAEELEFLYAPYKPVSKGSLCERAKALGLESYAEDILFGLGKCHSFENIVNKNISDLNTVNKVKDGICNIISHTITTNSEILEGLREKQDKHTIILHSTKTTSKNLKSVVSPQFKAQQKINKEKSKYEIYFKFDCNIKYLKVHQIMAINRGEKRKFLTVKLEFPSTFKLEIINFILNIFLRKGETNEFRKSVLLRAIEDCYTKKLQPLTSRRIRLDLTKKATKASIEVFAKNLKQLFLMSPLKGERIFGIDPGFSHGCKIAIISETADVLHTGVLYPFRNPKESASCGKTLADLLNKYKCRIIALGNGTACREAESWLTNLFKNGVLNQNLISYSIVSEQGASIYSCSDIAKKEFPNLDVNEISAVSIARRLNDPLSEYVKIGPHHIGVGMYQHDVNEKALSTSLHEIVSECVSYVGVDLNTASITILKHIAGLTEKKAEKIIEYRNEHGPFRTRKELLKVKSIGEKTYIQCAGFVRIEPRSINGKVKNLLDCTWLHPESYDVAMEIISKCSLKLKDIGTDNFIAAIKKYSNNKDLTELEKQFNIPAARLEMVLLALQRKLFQDYRSDMKKLPLFKKGVKSMSDLSVSQIVTGAVTNVTHFGIFIDIGVGHDALIHVSNIGKNVNLFIGDRVIASVIQIDIERERIGLKFKDFYDDTKDDL